MSQNSYSVPNKPDIRHVPLHALLLGLDSKCRGFPDSLSSKMELEAVFDLFACCFRINVFLGSGKRESIKQHPQNH